MLAEVLMAWTEHGVAAVNRVLPGRGWGLCWEGALGRGLPGLRHREGFPDEMMFSLLEDESELVSTNRMKRFPQEETGV